MKKTIAYRHCSEYRIINNLVKNNITVHLTYRTKINDKWVSDSYADDSYESASFTDEKKAFEFVMAKKKITIIQ